MTSTTATAATNTHDASTRRVPLAWIVVGLVCAVAFLVASVLRQRTGALLTKPVPMIALLATMRWRGGDRYDRWITAGLVASLVGDVFEELPGDHFIEGLVAFLAAHGLYVGAFWTPTKQSRIPLAPLRLVPYAIAAAVMLAVLAPRLGALLVPVVIYIGAIVVMAWRAAARVGVPGQSRRAQWAGCIGATCFMVSDSTLAIDKFHHAVHAALFIVMLTYWGAQVGIAASTRRESA